MKKYLLQKKIVLPQTSHPNMLSIGPKVADPYKNKVPSKKIVDPQSSNNLLDFEDISTMDLSFLKNNMTPDEMDELTAKFLEDNPDDNEVEIPTQAASRSLTYIVQTLPVYTYEMFYVGQNTNRLISHVAAICSTLNAGGAPQEYKAKVLNAFIKNICDGTKAMKDNPSGGISKAWLGKSGYEDKCAEYNKKNPENPLLSILDRKGENRRLRWSTVFPGHLAARIYSQNRVYKSLAEIALLPISEWLSSRNGKPLIYEQDDYGVFINDLVDHFRCTVNGLPVYVIMSSALISIIVEYLTAKGIIRPSFQWKSPTKKLRAARRNNVPLFTELQQGNEIWWLINEVHIPRSQQYFTYIPSVEWRAMWKPQLPPSMFFALNTPVLLELRGSLARHDKHFVDQRNLLLGDEPLANPDQIDLTLELPVFLEINEPLGYPKPERVDDNQELTLPLPTLTAPKPSRPHGARQMHAELADVHDLVNFFQANPHQIPDEYLPENFDWHPATEYEQLRALKILEISAARAAFSIGEKTMEEEEETTTIDERRRRYKTRAQTKKRSFNEGEDSPSKKNKASGELADNNTPPPI